MMYKEETDRKKLRKMAKEEARRLGLTFREMVEMAWSAYLENQARQRTDETFLLWRVGQH
jgi:hypothetical protein